MISDKVQEEFGYKKKDLTVERALVYLGGLILFGFVSLGIGLGVALFVARALWSWFHG